MYHRRPTRLALASAIAALASIAATACTRAPASSDPTRSPEAAATGAPFLPAASARPPVRSAPPPTDPNVEHAAEHTGVPEKNGR